MSNSYIKKTGNIDDLFSGYSASQIENKGEIEVIKNERIDEVIGLYKKTLESYFHKKSLVDDVVLTPDEILNFTHHISKFEETQNFDQKTTSFLKKLVQNSYKEGYNDFVINGSSFRMVGSIFDRSILSGSIDRPLYLTLNGNLGQGFGENYENINMTINGYCDHSVFSKAKNLTLKIHGDVGSSFAKSIEDSSIFINGNLGYSCLKDSKRTNLILEGNAGRDLGSYSHDFVAFVNGSLKGSSGSHSINSFFYVNGDLGLFFGSNSKNLTAVINGDVGSSAMDKSENSIMLLNGNIGNHSFWRTTNCKLEVIGDVSSAFGWESKNIEVIVKGDVSNTFLRESIDARALIKGNVESYFGHWSKNMKSFIEGNIDFYFGKNSNNFISSVHGKIAQYPLEHAKDARLFLKGRSGTKHNFYFRNNAIIKGRKMRKNDEYKALLDLYNKTIGEIE